MTIKEIAEMANVPKWKVYYICKRLGRVPTVEEVRDYKADKSVGRPIKYQLEDSEDVKK